MLLFGSLISFLFKTHCISGGLSIVLSCLLMSLHHPCYRKECQPGLSSMFMWREHYESRVRLWPRGTLAPWHLQLPEQPYEVGRGAAASTSVLLKDPSMGCRPDDAQSISCSRLKTVAMQLCPLWAGTASASGLNQASYCPQTPFQQMIRV